MNVRVVWLWSDLARALTSRVSERAPVGKTWLCNVSTVINSPGLQHFTYVSASPPPPAAVPPLSLHRNPPPIGFYLRPHSAGFVFSQRAVVPAYLKWMVLPRSGSAACYDDCKYGSTVPGGYTICTCSFCIWIWVKIPNLSLASLSPLFLVLPFSTTPQSFFCRGGGLKQVCLSSVYSMCPLCPHAPPRVPLGLSPAECALCRRWELLMSLCTYLWNTCDSCHLPL